MIPLRLWFLWSLFVVPAVVAALRQQDVWPFSRYPMFSNRITVESLVVLRIAIEDAKGQVSWWRPRFFRLQDTLCARFKKLAREDPGGSAETPAFLKLFAETQRLIIDDGRVSTAGATVLFVRRRVERVNGVFVDRDEVAARVPFPDRSSPDPQSAGPR